MSERAICGAVKADGSICRGIPTATGRCRPHSPRKSDQPVANLLSDNSSLSGRVRSKALNRVREIRMFLKNLAETDLSALPGYADKSWAQSSPDGTRVVEDLIQISGDLEASLASWIEALDS